MRVSCVRIINPATGQSAVDSHWVTIGSDYVVLTIDVFPDEHGSVRILTNWDEGPGVFDPSMFVTVDPSLPPNFACVIREGGDIELGPAAWLRPGFWEDYFDDEPRAVAEYGRELATILEADRASEASGAG